MMQRTLVFQILLLASPAAVVGSKLHEAASARANPIRKVVTLLQTLQKKVEAEGKKEKELYEKFMCYCNGGKKELEASVAAAEDKVPSVGSDIKALEGKISQLKSGLSEAQTNRDTAKATMAKAAAVRKE